MKPGFDSLTVLISQRTDLNTWEYEMHAAFMKGWWKMELGGLVTLERFNGAVM